MEVFWNRYISIYIYTYTYCRDGQPSWDVLLGSSSAVGSLQKRLRGHATSKHRRSLRALCAYYFKTCLYQGDATRSPQDFWGCNVFFAACIALMVSPKAFNFEAMSFSDEKEISLKGTFWPAEIFFIALTNSS